MEFIVELPRDDVTESAARAKFLAIKGFNQNNPVCFYDISKVELRPATHAATIFYEERANPNFVPSRHEVR
ncbi:hypothetical protein YA0721_21195 [Pseudomonas carnis]|nr:MULTISPECIES: hypothetical protein [Pseudomonas]MBI6663579.1 hypothetical protein [Pseudomonas carnis]MCF8990575.1 hypothetical protein [Pseudomonas carnis]